MVKCITDGCVNEGVKENYICPDCMLNYLRKFDTPDLMDIYTYLFDSISIPDKGRYAMKKMMGGRAVNDIDCLNATWFRLINKVLLERFKEEN